MTPQIELSIQRHIREQSQESLQSLYQALLDGELLVSVFDETTDDTRGHADIHVNCVRLADGEGCIPAFTSVDRLLEWEPIGSMHVAMPSRKLFEMANGMPEIASIYVNYSERSGTPKGRLARSEFEVLAHGRLPGGDAQGKS